MAREQARRMIGKVIEENPSQLELTRPATADNGFGELVPDPFGAATSVKVRGRIAELPYGAYRVDVATSSDAGVTVKNEQFLLVKHTADLKKGDKLVYNGSNWAVETVQLIFRFGDIVAKQARLKKADDIEVVT